MPAAANPWPRAVLCGLAGLVAATGVAWATLGHVLVEQAPASAIAIGRGSATALANRAIALLIEAPTDPVQVATAGGLATRALVREPDNARAATAAALAADAQGRPDRRDALLRYSESLSRRELYAQMELIETRVARGDIPGALRHYDRALTTSDRAPAMLLPVLASAAAEPAIAAPLAALLAGRPPWWRQFVEELSRTGSSPSQMRTIVTAARLNVNDPVERQLLAGALNRMIGLGGYRDAFALYAGATGRGAEGIEGDGGFDDARAVPPFDWQLIEAADIGGYPEAGPSGGMRLALRTNDGASGTVARRLVLLPPGGYALRVRYGGVGDNPFARPSLSLRCAAAQQAFQTFVLPPASTGVVARFVGTVPAACPAQWIEINVRGAADQAGVGWIEALRLDAR